MSKPIEIDFKDDWQKAVLLVSLLSHGLPPWASGEDGWKALSALTDWSQDRCLAALEEACRRGMIERPVTDADSFSA